jgi:hypothetical protein
MKSDISPCRHALDTRHKNVGQAHKYAKPYARFREVQMKDVSASDVVGTKKEQRCPVFYAELSPVST